MPRTHGGRAGRPILVTGSPRSGTTWVGEMLAAAPGVVHFFEPFSVASRRSPCYPRFTTWFTHVAAENEGPYRERIARLVELRYPWRAELRERGPAGLPGTVRRSLNFWRRRRRGERPLLKDPIAILSAEWLAAAFDTQNVVLIRHPCAFVASINRLGWRTSFAGLLGQPLLVRDLLAPLEGELRRLAESEHDLIENGAMLWKVIYHAILGYRHRHPDWVFARHEDLAREPLAQFELLYARLGLAMDDRAREAIRRHCYGERGAAEGRLVHQLTRDSRATVDAWRGSLDPGQEARVRALVGGVARHFYPDEAWDPVPAV
jgi:hypothetical protein